MRPEIYQMAVAKYRVISAGLNDLTDELQAAIPKLGVSPSDPAHAVLTELVIRLQRIQKDAAEAKPADVPAEKPEPSVLG